MTLRNRLLLRLKDKDTSIPDKLKLAKFAWAKDNVHIPNKHQHILDFVCGLLVNRKKHHLSEKDLELVWRTLEKLLGSSAGDSVIKPSILQAVNESLSAFTTHSGPANSSNEESLLCVVRCTRCLLDLSSVTTSQFEILSSLLAVVLDLARDATRKCSPEIWALLESVLVLVARGQKMHMNQSQVLQTVTDKLLKSSLLFLHERTFPNLQDFLLACLLHTDHRELYEAHLKHSSGKNVFGHTKQPPKSVGNVFAILSSLISQKNAVLATDFLPQFLKQFVGLNRSQPRLCFLLLKYVLSIVDQNSPKRSSSNSMSSELWLTSVSRCVAACQHCDMFSADTEAHGKDVLKWFSLLTESVLDQDRTPDWFFYLRTVLAMNHLIVEKFLSKVLHLGLVQSDLIPSDSREAQDLFLCDLVSTFVKLRSTPDLVTALTLAFESRSNDGTDTFRHLPGFYSSLCNMFQNVPPATLLETWEITQNFAAKVVSAMKPPQKDSEPNMSSLHWGLNLYCALLGNARLFDHRIAVVMDSRVDDLMARLRTQVLDPLCKHKEAMRTCAAAKQLLSIWTMCNVLRFPTWAERPRTETEVMESGATLDVQSDKLLKKLDPSAQIRLGLQRKHKAQAHSFFAVMEETQISGILTNFGDSLPESSTLTADIVHRVCDVNSTHSATALELSVSNFLQFSQLFPLIGTQVPESVLKKCAEIVVKVSSFGPPKATTTPGKDGIQPAVEGSSLYQEVRQFLKRPSSKEVKPLQESIAAHVWKEMLRDYVEQGLSPKKIKRKEKVAYGKESADGLVAYLTNYHSSVCKCSLMLDECMHKGYPSSPCLVLMDILEELPLENLPAVNLKCQIGLLFLLNRMRQCGDQDVLRARVEALMVRCLSVPNLTELFECVSPTDLVQFAIDFSSQTPRPGRQFLNTVVENVMRDRTAVIDMPAFAKKLALTLKTDAMADDVRMHTAAVMMNNCQRYSNFHVLKVKEAAMDIFFCLAKFVIKHGMQWLKRAKVTDSPDHAACTISNQSSVSPKRRKRKSGTDGGKSFCTNSSGPSAATDDHAAWYSLLEGASEVLQMWSPDFADDRVNQQLVMTATEILEQVLVRLKSQHSDIQCKVAELGFIRACCHCHMKFHEPAPESSLLSSPPSSPSTCFIILPSEKLKAMWTDLFHLSPVEFSLAVSRGSQFSGNQLVLAASGNSFNTKSIMGDTSSAQVVDISTHAQGTSGDSSRKTFEIGAAGSGLRQQNGQDYNKLVCTPQLDQMLEWPEVLTSWVDALAAVLESSDQETFSFLQENLLSHMSPCSRPDLPAVYVLVGVWRKLNASPHMSDALVQEWFRHMYQFLASILGLMQYFNSIVVQQGEIPATTVSTSGTATSSSSLTAEAAASISRFLVDSLTDFLNLGKTQITPRMTLLCLHSAATFTLTSPRDLEVLHKLTNSLLIYHTNTALTAVPMVIHMVNKLVSACIALGSEHVLAGQPQRVQQMVTCAHLVKRTLLLLSTNAFRTDLNKVAHCVLAEYVTGTQRGTLHTAVKKELVRGLYKLMGVCDKYRLAALNQSLAPGVRDTFRSLHQDYKKYHQYRGLV